MKYVICHAEGNMNCISAKRVFEGNDTTNTLFAAAQQTHIATWN